jgi:hypothetical protein
MLLLFRRNRLDHLLEADAARDIYILDMEYLIMLDQIQIFAHNKPWPLLQRRCSRSGA